MLRAGGTCTVIGMIPVGQSVEIPGYELLAEKKLMGSNMGSNRFRVDMPRYIDLYLDGRLKLDELVSRRISLDEVNDGFDAMKAGEVARSRHHVRVVRLLLAGGGQRPPPGGRQAEWPVVPSTRVTWWSRLARRSRSAGACRPGADELGRSSSGSAVVIVVRGAADRSRAPRASSPSSAPAVRRLRGCGAGRPRLPAEVFAVARHRAGGPRGRRRRTTSRARSSSS